MFFPSIPGGEWVRAKDLITARRYWKTAGVETASAPKAEGLVEEVACGATHGPNEEKADAAGTAEKSMRGAREKVATNAPNGNCKFANALPGVDQIGHASGFCSFASGFDGWNEAGIRGHLCDGKARIAQELADGIRIDTAKRKIGNAASFDVWARGSGWPPESLSSDSKSRRTTNSVYR